MNTIQQHDYLVERVHRVIDGDTYRLQLDKGHYQKAVIPIRLLQYDTAELTRGSAFERREGRRAKEFVEAWFGHWMKLVDAGQAKVWCHTEKDSDMSLGRWKGRVWAELPHENFQRNLGEELFAVGLASTEPLRWYEVYDPERNKP